MKLNKVETPVHSLINYKMKLNKVEPPVHSLKNYKMELNKVEPPSPQPQKLQDEAQ